MSPSNKIGSNQKKTSDQATVRPTPKTIITTGHKSASLVFTAAGKAGTAMGEVARALCASSTTACCHVRSSSSCARRLANALRSIANSCAWVAMFPVEEGSYDPACAVAHIVRGLRPVKGPPNLRAPRRPFGAGRRTVRLNMATIVVATASPSRKR